MNFAEKEHKKMQRKEIVKKNTVVETPIWFNKNIQDDNLSSEEEEELKNLLKEFN